MIGYVVVEDEPGIRRGIIKKIAQAGYPLRLLAEAGDGNEALQLIDRHRPQLVFTDMRMPLMDGKRLLESMVRAFPEISVIVISGHTDFEYMHSAISAGVVDYLLKPFNVQELKAVIKKALTRLESSQNYKDEKESLALLKDRQEFLAYLMGKRKAGPEPQSQRFTALLKVASARLVLLYQIALMEDVESVLRDYCWIPLGEAGGSIAVIVPEGRDSGWEALLKITEETWGRYCLLGISGSVQGFDSLREGYRQCIQALNGAPAFSEKRIFYYSPEEGNPAAKITPWRKTDILLFNIEAGRVQQTQELAGELFNYLEGISRITLGQVKRYVEILRGEVRAILYAYVLDTGYHGQRESLLDMVFDFETIKSDTSAAFVQVSRMLAPYANFSSGRLVEDIKTYVKKNYRKDLSQEFISSLFFVNPSYISSLFKKSTGLNYVDFLAGVRVEKAKELLSHTDLKTSQVARQVGIDNEKYFFRLFKKLTGMTPGEFKSGA